MQQVGSETGTGQGVLPAQPLCMEQGHGSLVTGACARSPPQHTRALVCRWLRHAPLCDAETQATHWQKREQKQLPCSRRSTARTRPRPPAGKVTTSWCSGCWGAWGDESWGRECQARELFPSRSGLRASVQKFLSVMLSIHLGQLHIQSMTLRRGRGLATVSLRCVSLGGVVPATGSGLSSWLVGGRQQC
jgi:hypothetical protein